MGRFLSMLAAIALAAAGCGDADGGGAADACADGGEADAGSDAGSDADAGLWPYEELFDEVWQILQDGYPYMDYKAIDWKALRDTCRPLVAGPSPGYAQWIGEAMDCLLAPLADYHVAILGADDEWHTYGLEGWTGNFDQELADTYLVGGGSAAGPGGAVRAGTTIDGGFGYLRVDSWADSDLTGVELEELVQQIGDAPGYVIDVRANSGGSELLAMDLAGLFVADTVTPYAFFQQRDEQDGDGTTHELGPPQPKTISPACAAETPVDAPVALLLGHKCMSSCELFASMMRLSERVETFGATTRGASGNPDDTELGNGDVLHHSTWLLTLADGATVLEWNGIPPEHPVAFGGGSTDEVLEAAVDWLADQ